MASPTLPPLDLMSKVVCWSNAIDVPYLEATLLHEEAQLHVRARAIDGVNNPLDCVQFTVARISFGKPPKRRQNAFTASVDLSELNNQRAGTKSDLTKYFRRTCAEYDRTDCNQGYDMLVGESKYFVHRQAFDQYPPSSV
jgi:hypothetical protein